MFLCNHGAESSGWVCISLSSLLIDNSKIDHGKPEDFTIKFAVKQEYDYVTAMV